MTTLVLVAPWCFNIRSVSCNDENNYLWIQLCKYTIAINNDWINPTQFMWFIEVHLYKRLASVYLRTAGAFDRMTSI
ncbi:hypothetical protein LG71_26050 [Pluralibacter gergoviae]|nr:hypothetical protein LG71_26050 [Pluralibacter gergoviae]